ncbi:hypothetical protein [Photobacterium kishitanii]|uniref:Uncharacterized protein n=1 Tax=Photobacterium kishitanii TaxID=318456 RepID=A0A2T3KLV0_9GAMM|nr:hypothetical protein [Photobacterium kishitanii]PSV00668.1 hypothetical protein C9J27_05885 [Photobacterium kishitanii]
MAKAPQQRRKPFNNDIDLFATLSLLGDKRTSEATIEAISNASGLNDKATDLSSKEYIEQLTEWVMENPNQLKKAIANSQNPEFVSRFNRFEKAINKSAPTNPATERGRWYLDRLLTASGSSRKINEPEFTLNGENVTASSKEFDTLIGKMARVSLNKTTMVYDKVSEALRINADDELLIKMSKQIARIGIPVVAGTAVASVAAGSSVALGSVAGVLAAKKVFMKSAIALGRATMIKGMPESYKSKYSKKLIDGITNATMNEVDERRIGQLFKNSSLAMLKKHQELSPAVTSKYKIKANELVEKIGQSQYAQYIKAHPRIIASVGFVIAAVSAGIGSESLERTGSWIKELALEAGHSLDETTLADVVNNIIDPTEETKSLIKNLTPESSVNEIYNSIDEHSSFSSTANAAEHHVSVTDTIEPPLSNIAESDTVKHSWSSDIKEQVEKTINTGKAPLLDSHKNLMGENSSPSVNEILNSTDSVNTPRADNVFYKKMEIPKLKGGLSELINHKFNEAGISFDNPIERQVAIEHFVGEIKNINGLRDVNTIFEKSSIEAPNFNGMDSKDVMNYVTLHDDHKNAFASNAKLAGSHNHTPEHNVNDSISNGFTGTHTQTKEEMNFNNLISDFSTSRNPSILKEIAENLRSGKATIPTFVESRGLTANQIMVAAIDGGFKSELVAAKWNSIIEFSGSEISSIKSVIKENTTAHLNVSSNGFDYAELEQKLERVAEEINSRSEPIITKSLNKPR